MKNTITFFLFLLGITVQAQIQKLSELSSAKFLDSKIIYEDNKTDVFGYFNLYEKDQIDKKEFLLEYNILDKNLNKVATGTFEHHKNSTFIFNTDIVLQSVIKNNNTLIIATGEHIGKIMGQEVDVTFGALYRTIDLSSFVISPSFMFVDFNKYEIKEYSKETMPKNKTIPQMFYPTKCDGFIMFQSASMKDYANPYPKLNEFRFYDKQLNEKWVYKYNQNEDKKNYIQYDFYAGEDNDLIFGRIQIGKNVNNQTGLIYENIDAVTGKKKYEISLDDAQNLLDLADIKFEDNKMIFYASTYVFNKKSEIFYNKKTGYAQVTFDRATGKELDRKYFKWGALSNKLDIDENGKIKSYGYIHFIDFKRTKDGKTIVIGEGYNPSTFDSGKLAGALLAGNSSVSSAEILDLFIIVFNDKMEVTDYHKVDKIMNRFNKVEGYGNYLENIGAFDYMYSQELPDDGHVLYYADNEKKGSGSKKNANWVLGIITYVDGKFDFQKMSLKTQNGNITPFKAKKGYILLREDSEKSSELRLEKINY
jgi:hypothetical protein